MKDPLTNRVTIETPEGIRFSYALATPISRCLAWLIDAALILTLLTLLQCLIGFLSLVSQDLAMALAVLLYFALSLGYGITLEWLRQGQTVGKKLLHLRVVDAAGLKLQPAQIILRNLLRPVDLLPLGYALGGLICLLSPRRQRLGDIAGGTLVVRTSPPSQPQLHTLSQAKFNSLRPYPHLCARLRQHVPQDLALCALQSLHRRNDLENEARAELFDHLAQALLSHSAFPPESLRGLSSEQVVRNGLEILYEEALFKSDTPSASRSGLQNERSA